MGDLVHLHPLDRRDDQRVELAKEQHALSVLNDLIGALCGKDGDGCRRVVRQFAADTRTRIGVLKAEMGGEIGPCGCDVGDGEVCWECEEVGF